MSSLHTLFFIWIQISFLLAHSPRNEDIIHTWFIAYQNFYWHCDKAKVSLSTFFLQHWLFSFLVNLFLWTSFSVVLFSPLDEKEVDQSKHFSSLDEKDVDQSKHFSPLDEKEVEKSKHFCLHVYKVAFFFFFLKALSFILCVVKFCETSICFCCFL